MGTENQAKKDSTYHYINERSKEAWVTSNKVGVIANRISIIWEDIMCLSDIRRQVDSDYKKKLLFKYILIELCSITEEFPILNGEINNGTLNISNKDKTRIRELYKEYNRSYEIVKKEMFDIRNNIGAHRNNKKVNFEWETIEQLWDRLESEKYNDIFENIREFHDYIKKLDIFDWSRSTGKESVEIICNGLNFPKE